MSSLFALRAASRSSSRAASRTMTSASCCSRLVIPLLECVDIGRRAEPAFSPSIFTQHVGELLFQLADPLGLSGAAFHGIGQIGLQCLPACPVPSDGVVSLAAWSWTAACRSPCR